MYLNTAHINKPSPPGGFGGAMCTWASCSQARNKAGPSVLEILQEANGIKDKDDTLDAADRLSVE